MTIDVEEKEFLPIKKSNLLPLILVIIILIVFSIFFIRKSRKRK
jgi:preprotein translocase subunit YajC